MGKIKDIIVWILGLLIASVLVYLYERFLHEIASKNLRASPEIWNLLEYISRANIPLLDKIVVFFINSFEYIAEAFVALLGPTFIKVLFEGVEIKK
jgi:hypothetical protein